MQSRKILMQKGLMDLQLLPKGGNNKKPESLFAQEITRYAP
jgi:hypothetical protein